MNQLSIFKTAISPIETEMDNACFEIGMKLANIAYKYYKEKSKICNSKDLNSKEKLYKDLLWYRKAFETIAKI